VGYSKSLLLIKVILRCHGQEDRLCDSCLDEHPSEANLASGGVFFIEQLPLESLHTPGVNFPAPVVVHETLADLVPVTAALHSQKFRP
jgi:hypothetical protein